MADPVLFATRLLLIVALCEISYMMPLPLLLATPLSVMVQLLELMSAQMPLPLLFETVLPVMVRPLVLVILIPPASQPWSYLAVLLPFAVTPMIFDPLAELPSMPSW